MKANELLNLSPEELRRQVTELKGEWHNLHFKVTTRQATGAHRLAEIRKEIARRLTILRSRKNA